MSKRRKKKRDEPRGLMKLEKYASNQIAPVISQQQALKIQQLYATILEGIVYAKRYDTIEEAAWGIRLLAYHAPCRVIFEFTPHEVMIALLNDKDEQVGWILITTKQTGIGKRSRKLLEAERSGTYHTPQAAPHGEPAQA